MSLLDTWNNLPTWGKWGIGIGIGGLLLYIIMHKSNSTASTTPTLTSDTSSPTLGSDVMGGGSGSSGSYDPTNQNGSQNNGTGSIGSGGGTSSTGSGGTSIPIVTQNPVPAPAPPPVVTTTPTTPVNPTVSASTSTGGNITYQLNTSGLDNASIGSGNVAPGSTGREISTTTTNNDVLISASQNNPGTTIVSHDSSGNRTQYSTDTQGTTIRTVGGPQAPLSQQESIARQQLDSGIISKAAYNHWASVMGIPQV